MSVLVRVYVRRRREVMMKRRKERKGASLFFRCSEQRLYLDWAEGRKENMTERRRKGQRGEPGRFTYATSTSCAGILIGWNGSYTGADLLFTND